jgi:hypothetical protein
MMMFCPLEYTGRQTMSISLSPNSHASGVQSPQGLNGMVDQLVRSLRQQEESITGDIREALDPSSPLMTLPKPIQEQFKQWDSLYNSPEEIKLIQEIKRKITEMHSTNQGHIQNKVRSNAAKLHLEFSIKAISKTVNGVQQLLSAQ